MSRSYKKHPYSGEKQNKENKQIANRKLRRNKNYENDEDYSVLNGKSYRKNSETWDIRDYGHLAPTYKEYKIWFTNFYWPYSRAGKNNEQLTEEKIRNHYNKFFRRK